MNTTNCIASSLILISIVCLYIVTLFHSCDCVKFFKFLILFNIILILFVHLFWLHIYFEMHIYITLADGKSCQVKA